MLDQSYEKITVSTMLVVYVYGGAYSVEVYAVGPGVPRSVLTVPDVYARGTTASLWSTVSL